MLDTTPFFASVGDSAAWRTDASPCTPVHDHVQCDRHDELLTATRFDLCRLDKVQKRASNVLKLAQENEKLKEELRAMNARIEAAERRQQELRQREAAEDGAKTS